MAGIFAVQSARCSVRIRLRQFMDTNGKWQRFLARHTLSRDKIVSKTGLVAKGAKTYDPIPDGKAEIVGYVNYIALGTDFETTTLDAFLGAYVPMVHTFTRERKPSSADLPPCWDSYKA
ncbi:hypothetical protein BG004_007450 [Podila humilis]|nr:hypothetical protein BG004_007450 [Podila humilis]